MDGSLSQNTCVPVTQADLDDARAILADCRRESGNGMLRYAWTAGLFLRLAHDALLGGLS